MNSTCHKNAVNPFWQVNFLDIVKSGSTGSRSINVGRKNNTIPSIAREPADHTNESLLDEDFMKNYFDYMPVIYVPTLKERYGTLKQIQEIYCQQNKYGERKLFLPSVGKVVKPVVMDTMREYYVTHRILPPSDLANDLQSRYRVTSNVVRDILVYQIIPANPGMTALSHVSPRRLKFYYLMIEDYLESQYNCRKERGALPLFCTRNHSGVIHFMKNALKSLSKRKDSHLISKKEPAFGGRYSGFSEEAMFRGLDEWMLSLKGKSNMSKKSEKRELIGVDVDSIHKEVSSSLPLDLDPAKRWLLYAQRRYELEKKESAASKKMRVSED